MRRIVVVLVVALLAAGCSSSDDDTGDDAAGSSTTAATTSEAAEAEEPVEPEEVVDPYDGHTSEVYDEDANWVCRPDLADDECRDLDVTILAADGTTTVEEREPAADPPIDCFYVYPTVSSDPGTSADLEWTPEDGEALTVVAQAAQYARSCRVYAPIYRQVTLNGIGGGASEEDRATAYGDVVDAWQTYISQWNEGRGVILIGHSQGTGHLVRLLEDEIDGVPELQDRLVSAHLFGGSVQAPEGEVVGGTFDEIPACTSADEAGCIVTWSSYPAAVPPDDTGIFGRTGDDGRSLCVDATDLLGEETAHPVAPVAAPLVGALAGTEDVTTPFVGLPETLDLSCASTADHDYLAVGLADPDDPRPDEGFVAETLGHSWGLHLVDVNVALDDLVALAERQGAAYLEE
ncbi:MAG TPA: DUF3089 domain-containing protein [Iamia sp.]